MPSTVWPLFHVLSSGAAAVVRVDVSAIAGDGLTGHLNHHSPSPRRKQPESAASAARALLVIEVQRRY